MKILAYTEASYGPLILKDNGWRSALVSSFVKCATHSISAGNRGGNLNAHLAYAVACGGNPMDKSVFCPSHMNLLPIHRHHEKLGWPGQDSNQEPRFRSRDSRRLLRMHYYMPLRDKSRS